jgi:protein MBA1
MFLRVLARGYASTGTQQQPKIELQHLGIATGKCTGKTDEERQPLTKDVYIHPSRKNLPSIFMSPWLRIKGVGRRTIALFQNTAMVAQFRLKSKIKPRFVEWKNLALEQYVTVNKAFINGHLDSIKDNLSMWVYESLKARRQSIPAGTRMEWKLVKFNSTPKIMSIQPMMLPDTPLTHVQIIYRIESRQKLVRVIRGSDKVDTVERDVTDYIGYVFDAGKTPAKVIMSGSVFESKCDDDMNPSTTRQLLTQHL